MYIYVDILIITNIYADFFLLKTAARLLHTPLRGGRCILGAMVGSLFSLMILLPPLSSWLLLLLRITSAALMIRVSFGKRSPREFLRIGAVFLFVCFIFAGVEYGIAVLAGGKNVFRHNSVLYVNISLLTLTVSTIVSYGAISVFRRFIDGGNSADVRYDVIITRDGKTVSLRAVGDTCNNLADPFTGKPVIVCGRNSLSRILNGDEADKALKAENHVSGWRLIPFSTIADTGMLPVFKPSYAAVKNPENGRTKSVDVYIGIVDREMEYAVFNPKILQ